MPDQAVSEFPAEVRAEATFLRGSPADELIGAAKKGVDLLMLGSLIERGHVAHLFFSVLAPRSRGIIGYDLLQRRRAVLRNFPIIGHLRYALEAFGPELRQYIITSNNEERPFSRDQRRWITASSEGRSNVFGFGTDDEPGVRLVAVWTNRRPCGRVEKTAGGRTPMTDQTITLTISKADAEVLLGVLSSERYNAEVEAVCDAVRKQLDERLAELG
jgi:hypothetical protein